MSSNDDWDATTWEGNRRRQHAEFRKLSLREKFTVVEQMTEVASFFRESGRASRVSEGISMAKHGFDGIMPVDGDARRVVGNE